METQPQPVPWTVEGDRVFKEYEATNTSTSDFDASVQAELTRQREAAPKNEDVYDRALRNFKNELNERGVTNIHQQQPRIDTEAVRQQQAAAPQSDFDA